MFCEVVEYFPRDAIKVLYDTLQVSQEDLRAIAREIFPHNHAEQLQCLRIWRHCVRRHDPSAVAQVSGDREFIVF